MIPTFTFPFHLAQPCCQFPTVPDLISSPVGLESMPHRHTRNQVITFLLCKTTGRLGSFVVSKPTVLTQPAWIVFRNFAFQPVLTLNLKPLMVGSEDDRLEQGGLTSHSRDPIFILHRNVDLVPIA
ncbi:unnamed protein product [Protopolystoma xenopodis]|uniref:Uncharacterized protein n=1 Tax=Protopolystoma xenopodis TaxID=117903 RepID=A0A448WCT3_9PLAT|nr:unnamed protein product [Protopolystoma xenopodis]